MRRNISVLGVDGTIVGAATPEFDNAGRWAGQLRVDEPMCEQVAQSDSKSIDYDVWRKLAQRCDYWLSQADTAGVSITHGSSTLDETAYFLHRVLACSEKPVVVTCAMRPATSLSEDQPQNLADAFVVASTPRARGVVVVCDGAIHGALDVLKQHTSRLDSFVSGGAGPIGFVKGNRVELVRSWPTPEPDAAVVFNRWMSATRWPRVEIVVNHAGNDGWIVRALIRDGVAGIAAAGTGNGPLQE